MKATPVLIAATMKRNVGSVGIARIIAPPERS
jgi:hypothetical protein